MSLWWCVAPAAAERSTSVIHGTVEIVIGDHSVPWSNARVWLVERASGHAVHATTDAAGGYEFQDVPLAGYDVFVATPDGARQSRTLMLDRQSTTVGPLQLAVRDAASAYRMLIKALESRSTERIRAASSVLSSTIAAARGPRARVAVSLVRIYGMRFERFLPHYYLGLSHIEVKDWCEANAELALALAELPNSLRLMALQEEVRREMQLAGSQCPNPRQAMTEPFAVAAAQTHSPPPTEDETTAFEATLAGFD
jgi:hypothetical protein